MIFIDLNNTMEDENSWELWESMEDEDNWDYMDITWIFSILLRVMDLKNPPFRWFSVIQSVGYEG